MKVNMLGMSGTVTPKQAAIGGTVAALAVWYLLHRAKIAVKETAEQVAAAVNPVNPENVFNEGFNTVYGAITDGKGTLGTDIYDFLHGGDAL